MLLTTLLTNFKYSHQPYLFKDKLLFCASNCLSDITYPPLSITDTPNYTKNILWQLYISDLIENYELTNIKHIATGYDIICSPIIYEENNEIYLSFLGGKFTGFGINYVLIKCNYDLVYNQIFNLQVIKENCFYGCVNNLFSIYGNRRDTNIKLVFCNNEEIHYDFTENFSYIYRVVFLETDITKILITGRNKNLEEINKYKTLLFDINENKVIGELTVNNQSLYKSTINNNVCIYSNKINEESSFEERQLIITDNFSIK